MLAAQPGALSPVAQLALDDLRAVAEPRPTTADDGDRTVAQLFLHADIDGALTHAGRGDTGGIATLLVHLGDALLRAEPSVCRVLTLSRGRSAAALAALADVGAAGHHYVSVPLWGPSPQAAKAWPLWVAARRGIRRALRVAGQVDALHLRMADVGSLAAASAAHELGVPLVLTLAPDPHALVASREGSGELTRSNIGDADAVEHLVFRDSLLRQLARRADHVVVFPRADLERDLRELLGIDLDDEELRLSVVPEGINLAAVDAGLQHASPDRGSDADGSAAPEAAALGELDALLDTLPVERRGLPLAISVGRLHPVKGMATLVKAWASRSDLSSRCNLLVVGGDLDEPNDDERGQLDLIGSVVPIASAASAGLLLAGHQPNATVATWLAATRHGRGEAAAPRGVYVSASLKEEFGIAILEAMAAGLVVVAPGTGGPATYVTSGESGVLADTASAEALAAAVLSALDLAASPEADSTAERTMATVRDRFGVDRMAATLAGVYEQVAAPAASGAGRGPRVVTLLVISPDYASHLYPLATLATAWQAAGERVVVATGPATAAIVRDFGFERVDLRLGRGSNPGVIRAEDQPEGEDDSLRGFFDATRRGAVETLAFQAEARGDDLLWDPVTVARDVQRIVADVRPDHVIVDHLAFSARLALVSAGVHHADVVLGHPSALTVGDEVYGYPPAFPTAIVPDGDALADLHRLCIDVRDSFTAQWNRALDTLAPGAAVERRCLRRDR